MRKNIVTYAEHELEPFSERPFCTVDSLILSWVSYMHLSVATPEVYTWEGVALKELFRAEAFEGLFREMWETEQSRRLLTALAASPRFRNIRVCGYTETLDEGAQMQFSAVLFHLSEDLHYIAFRGTDLSLVGWKEDFNMAFQCPVPSQEEARRYTESAARHCEGALLLGGHSKGGNLAVYAAATSEAAVEARIERVYSHDGPGFLSTVLEQENFRRIADKTDKTIPQSSVVGLLMEQCESYRVVKSHRLGVWQHDPLSWIVDGTDFRYLEEVTDKARYFDRTLSDWLVAISPEERERFIDALYGVLSTTGLESFPELLNDWQKNVPIIVKAAAALDGDTRQFLYHTLKELAVLGVKNARRTEELPRLPELRKLLKKNPDEA